MSALTVATTGHPTDGPAVAPVRLLPAPIAEPHPAQRILPPWPAADPLGQSALALDVAGAAPPARRSRPASRAAPRAASGRDPATRQPSPAPDDPSAETLRWAGQFVQAAVEVTAGLRQPAQLVRWTSDEVHATLTRRFSLGQRLGQRPEPAPTRQSGRRTAVRSIRGSSPREGVVEACAVITDHGRARAVAVRMERTDDRWRVTAIELG